MIGWIRLDPADFSKEVRHEPDFFNCFSGYEVRRLTEDDLNEMYALCAGNPLYYEHFGSP